MSDREHDTTIVTTGSGGGSSAAWLLIGALLVIVGVGAFFYLGGEIPGGGVDIKIEAPKTN